LKLFRKKEYKVTPREAEKEGEREGNLRNEKGDNNIKAV